MRARFNVAYATPADARFDRSAGTHSTTIRNIQTSPPQRAFPDSRDACAALEGRNAANTNVNQSPPNLRIPTRPTREAQWRPCRLEASPLREVFDWVEHYRRFWEASFDRLDEYLRTLQAKEHDNEQAD